VPCHDIYVTKGILLWREAWALRVLGLMNDGDSSKSKHIRRTFELIQAWVAAQAVADSASAAVHSHVDIVTHNNSFPRSGPPHQYGVIIVPPMDAHEAQCRCLDCENKPSAADVQVAPPQQHCCIDPLNLWKALPPVPKYMDMTAKHPTDSDSYNSAQESESELSSGFVSVNDDGIPDAHAEWVEEMCPITARALKRAKIGTFITQKKPKPPASL
jgi:hypothetical protein